MKVGDLVIVQDSRSTGGIPEGTIGIVLEEEVNCTTRWHCRHPSQPRWKVYWDYGIFTFTFGIGVNVLNEK